MWIYSNASWVVHLRKPLKGALKKRVRTTARYFNSNGKKCCVGNKNLKLSQRGSYTSRHQQRALGDLCSNLANHVWNCATAIVCYLFAQGVTLGSSALQTGSWSQRV